MLSSSQKMVRVRAIFAGWLFMCFLMRTMAADLDPVPTNPGAIEQQSAQIQDAAPSEAETAKKEPGSLEALATAFAAPTSGGHSLQTRPERKTEIESRKPGFF